MDFVGSDTRLIEITVEHIIDFHWKMDNEWGYSGATVAYSARVIRNFFEFWKGRGEVSVNPKEIRSMKFANPHKNGVSESDFRRMTASLNEAFFDTLQKKLALHLLYDTGMRVSELCGLKVGDIEETKIPKMRCAVIRRRKTFRYNVVMWGKETNRLLNLYLGLRLCMDDVETDALFVARRKRNQHMATRTVERWVEELTKKVGIEAKITPHSFRHAKAHAVLNKSGNVRDVQAILGHSSPESSFNYLHVNKGQFLKIAHKYLKTA
jgi:site-specific recombinase XerD